MTNQIEEEIYGSNDGGSNNEPINYITDVEAEALKRDEELYNCIIALQKNKNFKKFLDFYIDRSLVTLGLNFGVNPQMRQDLVIQIESRRVFKEFLDTALQRGEYAKKILDGVENGK